VAFRLPDGRWLVVRDRMSHRPPAYAWLWGFGALGIAIGIGAFPVVRRITGRLERLQKRVDALGAGDLGTRVEVEGEDEVARLAQSFNRAADRIERLVNAQRRTLASASHELRTPLARLRMALELLAAESRPDLLERATRDIEELDELIGELLLASKLDALDRLEREEQVDLLALVAEEAVRVDAEVAGPPTEVRGDPRLLRRLVRNLLDNARRYGAGSAIEVELEPVANGVCLRVSDRGPGVPESERERIFEPFYRPLQPDGPEGFGLGLALVRQIARHHGGDARCLPREGGGSVLEVRLGGRV
jgi:signal transduction histidine kinase